VKCKLCKSNTIVEAIETTIQTDSGMVRVINIPAYVCPQCGNKFLSSSTIKRAKDYINTIETHEQICDFNFAAFESDKTEKELIEITKKWGTV
jgi:YgiT-type zinc finger domain